MRYFGCHVSTAGGLVNALKNGMALGVNTIQIHPTPPQRWNKEPFKIGMEAEYLKLLPSSGIEKVFFHAIYLINLATPDAEKLNYAANSLRFYLELAERVGANGVVVHVGSNKEQSSEEEGLSQAISVINEVLEQGTATLLLEVAAGSGKVIGAQMEDLKRIFDGVIYQERLGFTLDTQHMWASGYDIKDNCAEVVREIDTVFGAERVRLIHLNDSKSDLASKVDRHENLGQGKITFDGLKTFINHPKLLDIPLVLETPAMKDLESAKQEVDVLRTLVC